jgi:hypothetical protein
MDYFQQSGQGGWSREFSVVEDLRCTIAVFRDRKIADDQGALWPNEDLTIDEDEDDVDDQGALLLNEDLTIDEDEDDVDEVDESVD